MSNAATKTKKFSSRCKNSKLFQCACVSWLFAVSGNMLFSRLWCTRNGKYSSKTITMMRTSTLRRHPIGARTGFTYGSC